MSIFPDLSKAFDTLDHAILLSSPLSIPLQWFQIHLCNRRQYAVYDGTISETLTVEIDVPRDCIFAALLFVTYINDIFNASENFKSIHGHKDCCWCWFDTTKINYELSNIQEWLTVNKSTLNVMKTKYILFHYRQRNIKSIIFNLKINSVLIERVTEFNFLCVTIDENLNSKSTQTLANKIARTLGTMNRLNRVLPLTVMRIIYTENALIISHLQYALLIWGFKLSSLIKLQKRAIRIVTQST